MSTCLPIVPGSFCPYRSKDVTETIRQSCLPNPLHKRTEIFIK